MAKVKAYLKALKLYPFPFPAQYAVYGFAVPYAISSRYYTFNLKVSLALLVALSGVYMFTFLLNTLSDVDADRIKGKNPLFRGELSKKEAIIGLAVLIVLTLVGCGLLYPYSPAASWFIVFGLLAGILYSTGLRLKESIVGPFVASLFHLGPAFLLLVVLPVSVPVYYYSLIWLFLLSVCIYSIFIELDHTVRDYRNDSHAGVHTFAVIYGRERTKFLTDILRFLYIVVSSIILLLLLHIWWAILAVSAAAVLYISDRIDLRIFNAAVFLTLLNSCAPGVMLWALIISLPEMVWVIYDTAIALRHIIFTGTAWLIYTFTSSKSTLNEKLRKKLIKKMLRY